MDPAAVINFAVAAALIFLAVSLTLLVTSVMPLLKQGQDTLASIRRLSDTIDKEIPPTLTELRGVMDGVNQIRALTAARVQEVGTKAEEVAGSVQTIVGSAKKESTVATHGLMAGLKSYFFGNKETDGDAEKALLNRERKNVELKH
ncbi:MAG: hypothetical protein K2X77_22240 [Candidatus Obscuribacterales bacterium]|nr:hypothetical protein [Candidatus Obscuribacterales bacterium]